MEDTPVPAAEVLIDLKGISAILFRYDNYFILNDHRYFVTPSSNIIPCMASCCIMLVLHCVVLR